MGRSWRVLIQINHFFCSSTCLKKWKKLTAKIYLIVCALTETKDHINPFHTKLPSPHHQVSDTSRWSERVTWNEQTIDKFSYLKLLKIFINAEFEIEVIDIDPSKALDSFKFKSFNVHSLAFSARGPASRVQRPESSVQMPASRGQRSEASVQSPASNSCLQSLGIPVCQ